MSTDNKNNSDLFNLDEVSELDTKEVEARKLSLMALLFVAGSLAATTLNLSDMITKFFDDNVAVVVCPRDFTLDAPVVMLPVRDASLMVQDRWIKGFIRRYILAQFPRMPSDVEPNLSYLINHSTGSAKKRYQAYGRHKSDMKQTISSGSFYSFYPKATQEIEIRATDVKGIWIINVNGYLVRYVGLGEERTFPQLFYRVVAGKITRTNPEGFYVEDTNVTEITDWVSGKTKSAGRSL